ncbi:hypothetical protein PR202_ga03987 [Eleusine coracana subsp. coracana]|uniref:Uncharacterized protein n=1 Tax=Eleusine coracana subsp. coracana TaxID=191504 RepID=A0AAV5BNS0_ELECO|nr:hypothetical protein PR202_ga03987 [Eleusine coracana subsp. coracana]
MAVSMRDKGYGRVYDASKKTVCFSRSASGGSVNWSGLPKVEMKFLRADLTLPPQNVFHQQSDGRICLAFHPDVAGVAEPHEFELERHLGRAVVIVPQHFGVAATWEAVLAAELAGLEVDVDSDTVQEPVAAAAAHGLHAKLREGGAALVLRVGGGSADASVVALWDGALEIIGYQDDPFLEGDDFDQRNKKAIDEVVLVGESTMIPKIQRLVRDYFDGKEPDISVKPDEALPLERLFLYILN